MAFGFPAKYLETQHYEEPRGVLEAAAKLAFDDMGLEWFTAKDGAIGAKRTMNIWSWGERYTVWVEDGSVECESRCSGPQLVDWGKNRRNVDEFFRYLREAIEEENELA